ncbi:MAG: VWA domain-containing protein [Candidatus Schekmanbacteria bacterium]|nr:MAG: VWA domain-containing protein [Candidatus Schekmanbacteria bacterium]
MKKYRYSEWDGTQAKLDLDDDELFDKLSEFFLREGDMNAALQWLIMEYLKQNPNIKLMSINQYLDYLKNLKNEYFNQFNMDYALDDIEEKLNEIIDEELKETRKQLKDEPDADRQLAEKEFWLKNLPPKLSKKIEALKHHDFVSKKSKKEFDKLLRKLEDLRDLEKFLDDYGKKFNGEKPLNFDEAVEVMKEFKRLDKLQKDILHGNFLQINIEDVNFFLDPDIAKILQYLQTTVERLEKAGYISVEGNKIDISAKGIRRIGYNALQSIYSNMKKDQFGTHETHLSGVGTIKPDVVKKYQFGDPFNINIGATLMNSLKRGNKGKEVKLDASDFEIYDIDFSSQTTTIMLIDMSFSMAWGGRFLSAKRVAIALDHLISTKFPKDNFYIVGFASRARVITKKELAHLMLVDGSKDIGNAFTNLQDALRLAADLASKHRSKNQQIILITDGQPTAYFHNNQLQFEWPIGFGGVSPRACRETMKEVYRCTRKDLTINTFMLDTTPSLKAFVQKMTKVNKGRAFYTSPSDLGHYVLVDYVEKKRKRVR